MQLSFSRPALIKQLRLFAILPVLFIAGTYYAIWIDDDGPKRTIAMVLMPFCAVNTLWIGVRTARFLLSGVPAGVIEPNGVRINGYFARKLLPWTQLEGAEFATIPAGKITLDAIQFQRKRKYPIRLPLTSLSNDRDELREWVGAVNSRLANVTS
jgi:hypothetical protein